MTDIAVIIVNFNAGSALGATLDSLPAGLAALRWDCVVVDNASADGSERAVYGRGDHVRLLPQPANVGFASGVNRGVAATTAPLLLLLNPDCELLPDTGRVLREELNAHPTCGVVGPRVLDADGTLQESARGDPTMTTGLFGRTGALSRLLPASRVVQRNLLSAAAVASGRSAPVDWVSGACMLIRRAALAQVGGFDERYFLYWEDADVCRRLRQAGWESRYQPAATVRHHVGQSSRTARRLANREFHRSAYRYYTTHVAPGRWHPGRAAAWAILRVRALLKGFAFRHIE